MSLLHFMIFLPFLFSVFVPFIYKAVTPKIHTGWFVLFVPAIIFIYLLSCLPAVASSDTRLSTLYWMPSFGIDFTIYLDGLGLVFGLLISGIGALVILYSIYYMSKQREALHNFYVYLLLFMGAMLGVVFSDNILVLYVFWELTSISSFLLIAYWYQREKSRYGARKSMLITIFGGFCLLAGFILLSMMADTYSIRELFEQSDAIAAHPLFLPSMFLLLIGAFAKSAQFPFSIWLPDAMEAPTPISAYLHSATMVKAGIYLVARFTPIYGGTPEWFWIVSGTGMVTLLYGSINAVRQVDLKALLAYSTISQLGLIMSLFGLGSAALYGSGGEDSAVYAAAITAAIFHLVNHSTFKGLLFMVVGIIDHETGSRDLRRLGGLLRLMPVSFTVAVIGAFSMAGLPPFNGFLSKEMFFTAVLKASEMGIFRMETFGFIFPVVAWVASLFTFIYCMILVFKTFAGRHRPDKLDKLAHEAPIGMLIPPAILASLVLLIFFFPNLLGEYVLKPAVAAVLPEMAGSIDINIKAWHGFETELFMTLGVVAAGVLLYLSLWKWIRLYRFYPQTFTLNNLYNHSLDLLEKGSRSLTDSYMTGYIRDYLVYILGFLIILIGGALWLLDGISIDTSNDAPVNIYEGALIIGMLVSAIAVLFSRSRLMAITALGSLGYLVSLFYVIFRAPDLALTQLVVETVTTALFLLCFYHLPKFSKVAEKIPFNPVNLVISLGVGAVVTIFALSADGGRLFEPIAHYYENSYELAGARNIVNAILVDFRGIDTMLEIFVLCIAALGVYTLIKLKSDGGEKNEDSK